MNFPMQRRHNNDEAENLIELNRFSGLTPQDHKALEFQKHNFSSTLSDLGHNARLSESMQDELKHDRAPKQRLHRTLYLRWINGWTAEVLSCALSAAALFCLIATLRYFEGRIITEMPLKISINTLVAVLATTIKASLLLAITEAIGQLKWLWFSSRNALLDFERFDLASRGPWGAFLLTIYLKMRHLPAFGAFITVLALAIEPFTQQVIHPVICHRVQSAFTATVPRANNGTVLGFHTGPAKAVLHPAMTAAMYTGLLNNSQTVESQCQTGNCTFPSVAGTTESYQTLGFSYACVDISQELHAVKDYWWNIPSLGNASLITVRAGNFVRTLITGAQYQESNYDHAAFKRHWSSRQDVSTLLQFTTLTIAVDWSCFKGNPGQVNLTGCLTPVGAECKLWPAVQSIDARVDLGQLNETVISEVPLKYDALAPNSRWLHISPSVLRNGTRYPCTPSDTQTTEQSVAVFNNTIWVDYSKNKTSKALQWYAQDCVWSIDYATDDAFENEFKRFFANQSVLLTASMNMAWLSSGEVWIKQLFNNGSASISTISEQVGQLARSMTAYNRKRPKAESVFDFAYGDVIKTETCVQVKWAWVSFPASLVAMTTLFLGLTIWSTKRNASPVAGNKAWKSSSLPVLFSGLEEAAQRAHDRMDTKSDMLDRAAELKVCLKRGEDGWRLRKDIDD